MAGILHQMVLHKLRERPNTGYGLCSEIERTCGHRPSYGSMYPLLERMAGNGLLTVEKEGRRKIYHLTGKGEKEAARRHSERGEMIDDLSVHMKTILELMGQDPRPMLGILERFKQGDAPLGPATARMVELRDKMFRMAQTEKIQRHATTINEILGDTIARLEALE